MDLSLTRHILKSCTKKRHMTLNQNYNKILKFINFYLFFKYQTSKILEKTSG